VTREPPWPTELDFNRDAAELRIRFEDGFTGAIPFELLRVESPSAETKGHGAERPPPPARKRTVGVTDAEPVGRYAVRIRFSDGHDTGLFTWTLLRELAVHRDERMQAYLQRLSEAGRIRD
jgi:DUF971 family protein